MMAFVYIFNCLLRQRPLAAADVHMLSICLNCLLTTDKYNLPDYIMQMICKGNKKEFHIFLRRSASHSSVFMRH